MGDVHVATPGQMALLAGQAQNSSGMASPKRASQFVSSSDNNQLIKSREQQHTKTGPKSLAMKTQHMNLASINIQPVIIDSNHFNNQEKSVTGASTGAASNNTMSPSK